MKIKRLALTWTLLVALGLFSFQARSAYGESEQKISAWNLKDLAWVMQAHVDSGVDIKTVLDWASRWAPQSRWNQLLSVSDSNRWRPKLRSLDLAAEAILNAQKRHTTLTPETVLFEWYPLILKRGRSSGLSDLEQKAMLTAALSMVRPTLLEERVDTTIQGEVQSERSIFARKAAGLRQTALVQLFEALEIRTTWVGGQSNPSLYRRALVALSKDPRMSGGVGVDDLHWLITGRALSVDPVSGKPAVSLLPQEQESIFVLKDLLKNVGQDIQITPLFLGTDPQLIERSQQMVGVLPDPRVRQPVFEEEEMIEEPIRAVPLPKPVPLTPPDPLEKDFEQRLALGPILFEDGHALLGSQRFRAPYALYLTGLFGPVSHTWVYRVTGDFPEVGRLFDQVGIQRGPAGVEMMDLTEALTVDAIELKLQEQGIDPEAKDLLVVQAGAMALKRFEGWFPGTVIGVPWVVAKELTPERLGIFVAAARQAGGSLVVQDANACAYQEKVLFAVSIE